MRRVFWFALAVALVASSKTAVSAIPQILNYQGFLRDAVGVPVGDGNHSVTFKFYDDSTAGVTIWEETQTITTTAGLFNVLLGSFTPVPETAFDGDAWLGTTVETDPEMTPRTKVASVGYAYRSADADSAKYADQSGNSDRLDGHDASEFLPTGGAPVAFNVYAAVSSGSPVVAFSGAAGVRTITGIFASCPSGGGSVAISVGGTNAIVMLVGSSFNSSNVSWSSAGGAPITVPQGATVQVTASASMDVTITGFEY